MPFYMPHAYYPHAPSMHFRRGMYSMPYRQNVPSCGAGFLLALLVCAFLPLVVPIIAIAFWLIALMIRVGVCFFVVNAITSFVCAIASSFDDPRQAACAKRCAFAKMASCAKKCSRAKAEACPQPHTGGIHPGVSCDRSGMSPIVGMRYHLVGHNWDLCQTEWDKCSAAEKALYTAIPPVRAAPATTVREEMATTDEKAKTPPAAAAAAAPPQKPPVVRRDLSSVRIQKDEDEMRITLAAPGVRSEDLDVSVLGNALTVTGSTTRGNEVFRVHRSVAFHEDVDVESAAASHAHGVLTLVLKRKQGKRIPVVLARAEEPAAPAGAPAKEEEAADEAAEAEQAAAATTEQADEPEHEPEAEASSSDEWVPLPKAE